MPETDAKTLVRVLTEWRAERGGLPDHPADAQLVLKLLGWAATIQATPDTPFVHKFCGLLRELGDSFAAEATRCREGVAILEAMLASSGDG